MRSFLLALGFLSIIPVRGSVSSDPGEIGRSSAAFPLVGLVMGAVLLAIYLALGPFVPPAVLAALLLVAQVALNGALHMDGLSDTFDAIAVRSGPERKLQIMKDGSAGPAGIVAVVLTLLLKFSALYSMAVLYPRALPFALISGPVLARWGNVASMLSGRLASQKGLAKTFVDATGPREFTIATVLAFAALTLGAAALGGGTPNVHFLNALGLVVTYLFVRLMDRMFVKRFGGITGDTLGAEIELIEAIYLVLVLIWSGLYI